MPSKNAMRDNVNAVRSRLTDLSDLPREQIELALLYYESNVDETVDAFNKNGAIEALSGWTEMHNSRGNVSSNRRNKKSRDANNQPSTVTPTSNNLLRPSQRVSNIFQTFAVGGIPTLPTNESTTTITTISSTLSLTPSEEMNVSHDPVPTTTDDVFIEQTTEQPKPQRRKSVKSRNNSATQAHETSTTTVTKSPTSNKKLLAKSFKDLQRQTSTLTNVELSFDNEIKSSIKRIDDIFKQIREIIKEREVDLYLEIDKVKEQGLNVIHRRQQRAVELRQRIDRCDRLEPNDIDQLRTDIKQFVTGRRYELGEELTSSHRFEYDQTLIESLKNFGHVLKIDRRCSIANSSALIETDLPAKKSISDLTPENVQTSTPNDKSPSNGKVIKSPVNVKTPDHHSQHFHFSLQTNGYPQYYDDSYNYQNAHRRRPPAQYSQRPYSALNYQNGQQRRNGSKQINGGAYDYGHSETTNTYRRPRPSAQAIVPVKS